MLKKATSIILLCSLTFSLTLGDLIPIWAQEAKSRPKVAVFPFADTNPAAKETGYGDAIAGMLTTELINGKVFQIIERKEIDRIMNELGLSQFGVLDSQTAKDIGKVYGLDMLVLGSVAKFGNLVETDSRLIDTQSGEAILADNASCRSELEIRNMVVNLARKMEQRFTGKATAQVMFNSEPAGAMVYINNDMAGITPLTKQMEYGNYEVKISLVNYNLWEQNVIVNQGENRINAQLIAVKSDAGATQKKNSKTWLYVLGGAALAGGAIAVLLPGPKPDEKKSRVTINVDIP
ncbi:PEGA domain-containing protein [candidate division KSB1 bacterium]|nr:PEGA domain-containing protein [candidate division KSB1 bacterium]